MHLHRSLGLFGLAVAVPAGMLILLEPRKTRAMAREEPAVERTRAVTGKPPRRVPQPLFGPAYVEALRDVFDLEAEDAAALERRLGAQPGDSATRLKLMAYYMRADNLGKPESGKRRAAHVLWLIEHHPESEILASPYAGLLPADLPEPQYQQGKQLWERAGRSHSEDARVMWNAAQFFQGRDQALPARFLERAATLAPGNEHYGTALGLLYGEAMVRGGDPALARHAAAQLGATGNSAVVQAAVRLFQNEFNRSVMMGRESPEYAELAQRYFRRALALNPNLDRAWVLPQLDPKMAGMLAPGAPPPPDLTRRFEAAARAIRRHTPEAFPQLPPAVAEVLRRRACLIPQTSERRPPVNVIRGEFFGPGLAGWAVLCSDGSSSIILVFRDDHDRNPEELARNDDLGYLQDAGNGLIAYSRQISPANREFILRHYRAFGGPEPPPISHQGIDDAFLEKASIVYYRHQGKWLQLQGAD